MKIRKLLAGTAVALGVLFSCGVYASISKNLEVVNHITTGDVDISLKEYSLKGKTETAYQAPSYVIPGMQISKIPRIQNMAQACWVRAKISYDREKDGVSLSDENLRGISEDWKKIGDYYYYTKILAKNAFADIFQSIRIPSEWNAEQQEKSFGLSIRAEAIQAANYTPDFDSDSPWGNEKILKCTHINEKVSSEQKENSLSLSVEFDGDSDKWIAVPEDFFSNLGQIMPGDVLEDTITIHNNTDRTQIFYFRTSTDGRTEEQLKLLEDIALTVSVDGKELYKGNLASKEMNAEQSLGEYSAGTKKNITFCLEVPADWDNKYAALSSDVTWIFKVTEEEAASDDTQPSSEASAHGGSEKSEVVKTGDSSKTGLLLLLAAAGLMETVFLLRYKKKARKER